MKNSKFILDAISAEREKLENPYAFNDGNENYDAIIINKSAKRSKSTSQYSRHLLSEVDKKTGELHAIIWKNRHKIWQNNVPSDPVDLLDPVIAIQYLGYTYEQPDFIGKFFNKNEDSEIAGIIDRSQMKISISDRLPIQTHRFTAAHELGHAVLHENITMHRDRPMDGSIRTTEIRDQIEIEADKFAANYIMPKNLLKQRFYGIYGTESFNLNEETAYALDPVKWNELINKCKTKRDIARVLAKATQYNGRHVLSLATQFKVSNEAMAIRIDELGLIII